MKVNLAMSQTVINNWHDRNDDKDMLKIRKECEKEVYKMYDDALVEEKRWATYLFSKGSMIGLSEKLLRTVCRIYGKQTNERYWFRGKIRTKNKHTHGEQVGNASQCKTHTKTEIESYVIGGIKQDVKKGNLKI